MIAENIFAFFEIFLAFTFFSLYIDEVKNA